MTELSEAGMNALRSLQQRTYPPSYQIEYEDQWFRDVLEACGKHGILDNAPVVSEIDRFFDEPSKLADKSVSLGVCCAVLLEAAKRGIDTPSNKRLREIGKIAIGQIAYRWEEKRTYA